MGQTVTSPLLIAFQASTKHPYLDVLTQLDLGKGLVWGLEGLRLGLGWTSWASGDAYAWDGVRAMTCLRMSATAC